MFRIFSTLILFASVSVAQSESMVSVLTDKGDGLGVIVLDDRESISTTGWRIGEAVTALHVVEDAGEIKVRLSNGQSVRNCRLLRSDQKRDLAWIEIAFPRETKVIRIADRGVQVGDRLRLIGREFREHLFSALQINDGRVYANVVLYPGDSGGVVVNEQNELVAIISGGWFWFEDTKPAQTWPLRAGLIHLPGK